MECKLVIGSPPVTTSNLGEYFVPSLDVCEKIESAKKRKQIDKIDFCEILHWEKNINFPRKQSRTNFQCDLFEGNNQASKVP